jgi:hypothetical protein
MRMTKAGLVGIGTASPTFPLQINSTVGGGGMMSLVNTSTTEASISYRVSNGGATTGWVVGNSANDYFMYSYTLAGQAMTLKPSGNVGIGNTSPSTRLDVLSSQTNSSIRTGGLEMQSYAVNNSWYAENIYFDGGAWRLRSNGGATQMYMQNGSIDFNRAGTGNAGDAATLLTTMRLINGNVLIGTTTDGGYKLRVNGEILADDDIRIFNTYALVLNGTDNNWRIGRNTITDSGWLTGNTMQMVVFGSSSGQGFQVVNSNGTALFEIDGVAGASRFSNALGVGVNPSGTSGRIDASNDIVAYSTSDSRLKENITPIANALDKVKLLTGVEFDWKEETKDVHGYEGHDVGVIAQEVQAVLPEAIRTNDSGYLSVRYEKMIALLIEGMKEQQNQIDELKAKLDGLTK